MKNAPSISDVAKAAGVSIKTVSRVINNEPNVSEKTRSAVTKAISSLSYTPSVSARILAGNKTYSLIIPCLEPRREYFTTLHFTALTVCKANSYQLQVQVIEDFVDLGDAELLQRLNSLIRKPYPDGFILIPPFCDSAIFLEFLRKHQIAYVRISPNESDSRTGPMVAFDEEKAAYELVQSLIDYGHRRIALVQGIPTHAGAIARTNGYKRALRDNGLDVDPTLIIPGDFIFASGLEAGRKLMALPERPTAVFASNDEMAAGVNIAAHKAGLDVPDDISIVGFDDDNIAQSTWPPLTTVRQPLEEMVTTAVNWLVNENTIPDEPKAILDYVIVTRDSSGPAP